LGQPLHAGFQDLALLLKRPGFFPGLCLSDEFGRSDADMVGGNRLAFFGSGGDKHASGQRVSRLSN
jgi:hypothetical protein